jgi:hypothetical protein
MDKLKIHVPNEDLIEEAVKIYSKFHPTFEEGEQVYLVANSWVKNWQAYVYWDLIESDNKPEDLDRAYPGSIDCSEILAQASKPLLFHDITQPWLSKNISPNEHDYVTVSDCVYQAWKHKYGEG